MTSPDFSVLAAATGSWPANGAGCGSFRNSSCQASVKALSHFTAVTATPVLVTRLPPPGGSAMAPPVAVPDPALAPPDAEPVGTGVPPVGVDACRQV